MTTNKGQNNLLIVMMAEDVKDRGGSHYVVPKVKAALETAK
jgi:penicillin-binding protein